MKTYPVDFGVLHFVGIGGIGMSGIAEVMHNIGYKIKGSDVATNSNVSRLRNLGIEVATGHAPENLGSAGAVVVSSAVPKDNVEVAAARAKGLPLVARSEMLAELMRLKTCITVGGTHGKTTTTSMIAALLDTSEMDPTVINGGIINAYGTNARLGGSEWMVVEADESDGSFLRLPSTIAVLTNIDPEHLDHYGNFDALRKAFQAFMANVPFYGLGVLCSDHHEVRELINNISNRRVVTYGLEKGADVRGVNVSVTSSGSSLDIFVKTMAPEPDKIMRAVHLNMPGLHNVRNALAMVAIGYELGISEKLIRSALANFGGVRRRFTLVGEIGGIKIIDDYGHHPVEIAAVLETAKHICEGKVVAVVQPHRYSRLKSLFKEFCGCFRDADVVVVADVHPAGEEPIKDINRETLVAGIVDEGHAKVYSLPSPDALPEMVLELCVAGDTVVFLGAGNVTRWANDLPQMLRERGISFEHSSLSK